MLGKLPSSAFLSSHLRVAICSFGSDAKWNISFGRAFETYWKHKSHIPFHRREHLEHSVGRSWATAKLGPGWGWEDGDGKLPLCTSFLGLSAVGSRVAAFSSVSSGLPCIRLSLCQALYKHWLRFTFRTTPGKVGPILLRDGEQMTCPRSHGNFSRQKISEPFVPLTPVLLPSCSQPLLGCLGPRRILRGDGPDWGAILR